MSDVWRILMVDGDGALNQNVVNALRKDGYAVRGVMNGADAVRILWSEEIDVVICDLKTPGADGFELLQWLRVYRPNTRMIMVGAADPPALRVQAMENGAVGYLEKPLDLRLLKDELRRLQQQSGFTASLDSFDLLDVIQIITMSRKSITLLVNTGLEEHGTLRFQNGELIWAEYGVLRGEEAFFALAAHKNGTVTQQLWDEQVAKNVTQPLSRLIFQALQYRSKYADRQQYTGEIDALKQPQAQSPQQMSGSSPALAFSPDEIDDRPFVFAAEDEQGTVVTPFLGEEISEVQLQPTARFEPVGGQSNGHAAGSEREWWERTGQIAAARQQKEEIAREVSFAVSSPSEPVEQTPSVELPSWLVDQPTAADLSPVRSPTPQPGQVPATPRINASSDEWQEQQQPFTMTEDLAPKQSVSSQSGFEHRARTSSSPAWDIVQAPHQAVYPVAPGQMSGPLRNSSSSSLAPAQPEVRPNPLAGEGQADALQDSNPLLSTSTLRAQRLATRRNYAALISALQTLGYSISGFIAAAVVNVDGQPVAQVAIDDLDISRHCRYFSNIQKSMLQALEQDAEAGDYEEMVITSVGRHILMRAIDTRKKAFLVLITTREANPSESLEVMANVEGAISAALR